MSKKKNDNAYIVKIGDEGMFLVAKEVEECLKLRGMMLPPIQDLFGMKVIVSSEAVEYLDSLYQKHHGSPTDKGGE